MHIGVFDSGVGGLTVLKALKAHLPRATFTYLGDTARLPYGTKSPDTIMRYVDQNVAFLQKFGVQAIVVACNSASSVVVNRHWSGTPVFGVIEPGAQVAARASRSGRIGVVGTRATIGSASYQKGILALRPEAAITAVPCPLLVPLVEEGWEEEALTLEVIARYVAPLRAAQCDTVVLGCTHYPVLKQGFAAVLGPEVTLVDPGESVATALEHHFVQAGIEPVESVPDRWFCTDLHPSYLALGQKILGISNHLPWQAADLTPTLDPTSTRR
ncbi:MAG: glutamate racemase [Acidobacteria bacterium]|nr:glutamate racemase [Acidobacteriota bacterium]